MHIRMMHIQHPAKQQQDLESFYKLREEESFCDMTFVTTNGKGDNSRRSIKVHSLVQQKETLRKPFRQQQNIGSLGQEASLAIYSCYSADNSCFNKA